MSRGAVLEGDVVAIGVPGHGRQVTGGNSKITTSHSGHPSSAALCVLGLLGAVLRCHAELPLPFYGDFYGDGFGDSPTASAPVGPRGWGGNSDAGTPQPGPHPTISAPGPTTAPGDSSADAFAEEGELRLVGRVDVNGFVTGSVQVFLDNKFGAVCSKNFGAVEADVACRQLGFIGGTNLPLALLGGRLPQQQERSVIEGILAPMVLGNLACTGTEARLVDCSLLQDDGYGVDYPYTYKYYESDTPLGCDPLEPTYAFVACGSETGPERGDLRLTNGATSEDGSAQFGQLEIFNDGGWGTVCGKPANAARNPPLADFTDDSVDVACKQLGFVEGTRTQLARNINRQAVSLGERRIPFWVAGAACTGAEDALTDCPEVGFANNTIVCSLTDVVSIICIIDSDPAREGNLRLQDGESGPGYEYGRLEVFLRGFWSTICDRSGFTPDAAVLACSLLGFDGGAVLRFRVPYSSISIQGESDVLAATLPVGLASVDCNGTESSLLECTSSQMDVELCGIGSTNLTDATVIACGKAAPSCEFTPSAEEGSVRLRGGFGSVCDPIYTGFVEVFHLNEWGAICISRSVGNVPDQTDRLAADVVCRQLGFPHGTLVDPLTNSADPLRIYDDYGGFTTSYDDYETEEAVEPQDRFWLDYAACQGPEDTLLECNLGEGFLMNNSGCQDDPVRLTVACRMFPVRAALEEVTTPGAEEGDVRLVDQSTIANWQLGRLEIFFEGSWSQVCRREFGGPDAEVACRQLGFGAGTVSPDLADGVPPPSSSAAVFPEVAITSPGCNGTEANLLECGPAPGQLTRFETQRCLGNVEPGWTIACVVAPILEVEATLRLTDGVSGNSGTRSSGILEIFHAGAWGTVCDTDDLDVEDYEYGIADGPVPTTLPETSAVTACRQLGFERGVYRTPTSMLANVTLRPPWISSASIPCNGGEDSISQCGTLNFGNTELCRGTQSLVCTSNTSGTRGEARLVGGRSDPGGAWAYGRLEVFDGDFFSSLIEVSSFEDFGRRGAQVACRSLGFTSGAQIMSGVLSALPGSSGVADTIGRVICLGNEATMADCEFDDDYTGDYRREDGAIALVCSTPSGCAVDADEPEQGDVRLVDTTGITSGTKQCDAVHFGAVEIFNAGQWGRICAGSISNNPEEFTIEASVVCKQLGFPFGTLYDLQDIRFLNGTVAGADYEDYGVPADIVWATSVLCTGREERLDECFFPEDFGDTRNSFDAFQPASVAVPAPATAPGIQAVSCRRQDGNQLGVVCRQFGIEESEVIRRL